MVQVNVHLPTGSIVTVEVEGTDTVESVTHKIYALAREPKPHPCAQVLHFNGQRLERRLTLGFYKIGKEDQLQLQEIPATKLVKLNVRGTRIETTLDTLLADPGSLLYLMFEPMTQGGDPINDAAARSSSAVLSEGVPHQQYRGRPGPLPCEAGVYFIDNDPISFGFLINYLAGLSRAPRGMMEPEPEGADQPAAIASPPAALPDSPGGRVQLAIDAQHYVVRGLVEACAARPAADVVCHSLASLVSACGPGATLVDILALPAEGLSVLFTQLSVNVVQATRIRAEIATEQARRQAEIAAEQVRRQAALDAERAVQEAERAVQAFRAALEEAECAVSEAGARALHAAGIARGDLYEMDAATAQRRAGVSAEDAGYIAALEKRWIDCPYASHLNAHFLQKLNLNFGNIVINLVRVGLYLR